MRSRTLPVSLVLLACLATSSPAEEPAFPVSPAWASSLDGFEAQIERQATSFERPDPAGNVAGLDQVLRPVASQLSGRGGVVEDSQEIFTADGPRTLERSTVDAAGRAQLLEEVSFGLTPPMGLELRPEGASGLALADYQRRMQRTQLPTDQGYAGIKTGVHSQLAPAVVSAMEQLQGPEAYAQGADGRYAPSDLAAMTADHRFFGQADNGYLPWLERTHDVTLSPELLRGLERPRARWVRLGEVLADPRYGIYDPRTGAYDVGRIQAGQAPEPVEEVPRRRREARVSEAPAREVGATPSPAARPGSKGRFGLGLFGL